MLRNINTFSWKQLEDMPHREDIVILLPISSLEQHGPQLPIGTDDFMLQMVLDALIGSDKIVGDMLVLPTLHFGLSPEHLDFTGTFTLSPQTMMGVVEDIIRCMRIHGYRHLLLLNSHGGNTGLLHALAQTWNRQYDVEIYHIDIWGGGLFERAAHLLKTPVENDVHGGEIETSILMFTGQTTMTAEEIANSVDYLNPIPANRGSWTAKELSDSGAIGGVSQSTAETGRKLSKFMIEDVAGQINSLSVQTKTR